MIYLNHDQGAGKALHYAFSFTFGRVLNDLQSMGIDEECMDPLLDKIMETGGDRGIFGTDRGGWG
jgi:hypothetical protein